MYKTMALSTIFLFLPQTLSVSYSIDDLTLAKSVNFWLGI